MSTLKLLHATKVRAKLIMVQGISPVRQRNQSPSAVRHGERGDQTYLRLRELIVRGRLEPNSPALESKLALQLGVSRTPTREALARLSGEGFLVAATNGRRTELVVAPLSAAQMHELWHLIGSLEGIAIATVSTMGRERRRQLGAAMAEVNDELAAAVRKPRNVDRISELQTEFHVCFMDACTGAYLRRIYDAVRPHVQRYEWAYGTRAGATYFRSIADHRAIIDAVGRGNGKQARKLIEQHWANAVARTAALVTPSSTRSRPTGDR